MSKKILLFTLLTIMFSWSFSFAEGPLKVCVSRITPNVIKDGNHYTGFDIELWEVITKDIGLKSIYEEIDFKDMLMELESGRFDVGISGMTIRSDREEMVDFSHHYLDSGLQIVTPADSGNKPIQVLRSIFTKPLMSCLFYFIVFIITCGHILWLSEKGSDEINDRYFPGIFEAFWCVHATVTTVGYGDKSPRTWTGRVCAAVIAYTGIAACGIFISLLASTLTTQKITSNISNLNDLRGKLIATKGGTTSEDFLNSIGSQIKSFENIDDAYATLLTDKEIKAVVFDSPSVMYFAEHDGKGKVRVVKELFDKQYYGFPINPKKDDLREQINRSLLRLREVKKGEVVSTYDKIYNKWFNQGG